MTEVVNHTNIKIINNYEHGKSVIICKTGFKDMS